MPIELLLLILLILTFIVGTTMDINIGLVAMVAAIFGGLMLAGMTEKEILEGFPTDLFVALLGITLLMGIASLNGSIDWLVGQLVRLSGGSLLILPWALFFIAMLVASFGTMAAPMLFIVGVGFAARYQLNPLLMGAMVLHGNQAGSFSPIAPYGVLFSQLAESSGFSTAPVLMYGLVVGSHIVLAVAVFFLLGGRQLVGAKISKEEVQTAVKEAGGLDFIRSMTVLGFLALLVTTVVFKLNIGIVAITIAFILMLLSDVETRKAATNQIAWPILLIIAGVLMLAGVLKEANVFVWLAQQAEHLGSPFIVGLIMCFLAAGVTAVSSTFATFGILIPMAAPFVMSGDLPATGLLAAIAISAAVTDISPFSPFGALFLSTAKQFDGQKLLKQCLAYTLKLILIVPPIAWLLLVVLG